MGYEFIPLLQPSSGWAGDRRGDGLACFSHEGPHNLVSMGPMVSVAVPQL